MAAYVDFRLSLDSQQRLARIYPLLEKTLSDMRPVFSRIMGELPRAVRETFDAEGPGWKQLAPFTVRMREQRIRRGEISVAPAHPILVQTGALRESLISKTAFGHFERAEKTGMVWGTTIAYATKHQYGTGRVPQRRILNGGRIIPLVSRILENEIPDYIRRAVRQVG